MNAAAHLTFAFLDRCILLQNKIMYYSNVAVLYRDTDPTYFALVRNEQ